MCRPRAAGADERRTPSAGVLVVHGVRAAARGIEAGTEPGLRPIGPDEDHTPPPMRIPHAPPPEDVLVLRGHPDARSLIADIGARLIVNGLVRLVIDLDGCEL